MIHPLNNSKLETGIRAYLVARLAAASITVPAPDGSATVPRVAPTVIISTADTPSPENQSWVAVQVPDTQSDMTGVYGDKMPVRLITVSPFPFPPGMALTDHQALVTAVAAAFPPRPALGSATYEDDIEAWTDANTALSAAVTAAAGYLVNGWYIEGSQTNRPKGAIEDVFTLRPCVYHPDVA
jgi:hypothetical protein